MGGDNHLSGEALNTHCELLALRLLVESIFSMLPRAQMLASREEFERRCESARAVLLGGPHREELLNATERALALQLAGIGSADSPLPPGALG